MKNEDPALLAGYTLRGRLGEGGQGVVYLGEDGAGRQAAVKLLRPGFTEDAGMLERFIREAETAQRVAPFCTAQILDSGTFEGRPYIVTEFIDGPSLHDAVVEGGPKSGADLHRLAIGTITALTAIHEAGIVHRDLKPRNVLLAPDGPRVIDFGIAKALDVTSSLTGAPIGTPAYIAPEILAGEPAESACDLFSWGCTIAFAAQGGSPFEANSLPAVINKILNLTPDLSGMSEPLRSIVGSCLSKEPAQRPTAERVLLSLLQRPTLAPGVLAEAAAAASQAAPPPAPAPTFKTPEPAGTFPPPPATTMPGGRPYQQHYQPGPQFPGPPQSGWTPPQTHPASWPAPRPPGRAGKGPLVAVAALLALMIGGGAYYVSTTKGDDNLLGGSLPTTRVTTGGDRPGRTASSSPRAQEPGKTAYFSDATGLSGAFTSAIGSPLKIKRLVIYPDYAMLTAEDPKKKGNVDSYLLRGTVGEPRPEMLAGDEKTQLTKYLFPITSVDFSVVPKLVKDTTKRLAYDDLKISHIILEVDLPWSSGVTWKVYGGSERESGYVKYTLKGRFMQSFT
ncbi:hypothetical protein GCM10010468_23950 [Actinocorallia longicatena]|uniref:non-specific serine/threonine protein kinase n=1 Tax=Actinocorallia longicatena TaxID=111803 RepID=A0ABP6Q7S0_9ACTN